jgi:hypothetical protein
MITTTYEKSLSVIRLIETNFTPDTLKIQVNFGAIVGTDHEMVRKRLKAINTWIEEYLDQSIIYNAFTDVNTEMIEDLDNHVVLCPDEPYDYLLGMLIYSKILAFVGTDIEVNSVIFSSQHHGFSQVISGDLNNILPNMKDWVGARAFHSTPWWNRTDSSTFDIIPEPHEDIRNGPEVGIELVSSEEKSEKIEEKKPKWTPRIIVNDD